MALPLRLIVGLGNPGRNYAATRHNAGAWFVERLARTLGLRFAPEARFHSLVARDRAAAGGDVRLVLPQDYMNESGLRGRRTGALLSPLAAGDSDRARRA